MYSSVSPMSLPSLVLTLLEVTLFAFGDCGFWLLASEAVRTQPALGGMSSLKDISLHWHDPALVPYYP